MVSNRFIFIFALALLALIFFSGCLVSKNPTECDELKANSSVRKELTGAASACYHELAVGYAIQMDNNSAITACKNIGDPGLFSPSMQSELNNCYFDIAEIMHDNRTCDLIEPGTLDNIGAMTGVWDTYREECYNKSKALNYDLTLCSSAATFALVPMLALFASAYGKRREQE